MRVFTITLATSLACVAIASTSRAAEPTQGAPAPASTAQPPPAQPAPPGQAVQPQTTQTVVVPQAQPAPAPTPVGTTTTTSATFPGAEPRDETMEKRVEQRPNRLYLTTGISIFVVSYVPSVIVAAESPRDEDQNLYIPVVGPWIDLAQRDCTSRACGSGSTEGVAKAMIVTSGIAQGVGVLLGVGSLLVPATTTEETRVKSTGKPELHFTPLSYGSGAGLGAVGRF